MQPLPHSSDATNKIWSRLASWLQRYTGLKVWTTTTDDGQRRTDDRPLLYYKLTLWAFGSGELKTQSRVTVLALCTSSHIVLHLCKVSCKYLKRFLSYRADTILWQRFFLWQIFFFVTDGQGKNNMSPNPSWGDIKIKNTPQDRQTRLSNLYLPTTWHKIKHTVFSHIFY